MRQRYEFFDIASFFRKVFEHTNIDNEMTSSKMRRPFNELSEKIGLAITIRSYWACAVFFS